MDVETRRAVVSRIRTFEDDVAALRRVVDSEELATNDRQYVSRCFDLLTMELLALRDYLEGV